MAASYALICRAPEKLHRNCISKAESTTKDKQQNTETETGGVYTRIDRRKRTSSQKQAIQDPIHTARPCHRPGTAASFLTRRSLAGEPHCAIACLPASGDFKALSIGPKPAFGVVT